MEPKLPEIDIKFENTTEMSCEKCQCNIFAEGIFLRKVSKFVTGSPVDSLVPIGTFYCVRCQHVNEDLLPKVLKDNK